MFTEKLSQKTTLPTKQQALAGRDMAMPLENRHYVHGRPLQAPFSDTQDTQQVLFGMGCFWGAERLFWDLDGVFTTAVGYAAGITPNPTYEEVCSGLTGHNEVVLVVYIPSEISFNILLKHFFESHNPTQGMRQGNDRGSQYRSGIYCYTSEQLKQAQTALSHYQMALNKKGFDTITTQIDRASDFYYAEQYHQQYLAKNPQGYCGIGGTGVSCALPETVSEQAAN